MGYRPHDRPTSGTPCLTIRRRHWAPLESPLRAGPAASYEKFEAGTGQLADFKGRPVVLNFWASDCAPCVSEMPAFERAHQRFGDKVAFVGLDVESRDDAARRLAAQTGVTYPL